MGVEEAEKKIEELAKKIIGRTSKKNSEEDKTRKNQQGVAGALF